LFLNEKKPLQKSWKGFIVD